MFETDVSLQTYPTTRLSTFPEDDKDYSIVFEVPTDWLIDVLERLDERNENVGVNLADFMANYIWDESWFIYELARKEGKVIRIWKE